MTVSKNSAVQKAVLDAGYPDQLYIGLWFWCCEREDASTTFLSRLAAKANRIIELRQQWDLMLELLQALPASRRQAAAAGLWAYWSKKKGHSATFHYAKLKLAELAGK